MIPPSHDKRGVHIGSIDHANTRLQHVQWLNNDADRQTYQRMLAYIDVLKRPNEKLTLPGEFQPYAWRAAYEIYTRLQAREREAKAQQPPEETAQFRAVRDNWSHYCAAAPELQRLVSTGVIDGLAREFLDIREEDLQNPVDNRFPLGRRPDWQETASRVCGALSDWLRMSETDRAAIPRKIANLRLRRQVASLEARVAALESIINPKQKEIAA